MSAPDTAGDVADVPPHLSFDIDALARFLSSAMNEDIGLRSVAKFTGGQSNPTYRLDTKRGPLVLRRKPPGRVLASAHAVDREAQVLRALGGIGFPVPGVLAESEDPAVIGSAFYVMEYLDGRIFWDPLLPDLTPDERRSVYLGLVDTLAELHAVDIDAAGLSTFGPRGNYYSRQIERWTAQYRAAPDDPVPEMEQLASWLASHVPEDDQVAVVHGDYRLDNVVFRRDVPVVLGVLDWELATLGNPLADLSYFLLNWVVPLGMSGKTLVGVDLAPLGIPTADEITDRYFARSPIARPASFSFHHAYNLFRLAAILHGIAARARAGNASNDAAARTRALVKPAALVACRIAGLP